MTDFPWVDCRSCGERTQATYSEPTRSNMVLNQLCFDCLFWTELVRERQDPTHFVAEGNHYTIGPEDGVGPGGIRARGYGGRRYAVYFTSPARRVITTNLWHQGEVPERFRDRLPDNAVLVTVPNLRSTERR